MKSRFIWLAPTVAHMLMNPEHDLRLVLMRGDTQIMTVPITPTRLAQLHITTSDTIGEDLDE